MTNNLHNNINKIVWKSVVKYQGLEMGGEAQGHGAPLPFLLE